MDTTRLPAAMRSYNRRQIYLHNNLVKTDVLNLAGEKIDLSRVTQPRTWSAARTAIWCLGAKPTVCVNTFTLARRYAGC